MSNRRKPRMVRITDPNYGRKARRPMFRMVQMFGRRTGPSGSRDRTLRGKDRVKARKAAQRALREPEQ